MAFGPGDPKHRGSWRWPGPEDDASEGEVSPFADGAESWRGLGGGGGRGVSRSVCPGRTLGDLSGGGFQEVAGALEALAA